MPELDNEMQLLSAKLSDVSDRLIRLEVQVQQLCHTLERHEDKQYSERERVPTLLIAIISVSIMAIGVLVQIWLTRGP